jgi:eukaryotic-like serine/threonine-protein kinase
MDRVGEGAFGEVYRAWDTVLEREVALKLLHAADEDLTLLQEARMLARLRHPNVVTVYGADRHDGRSGVWMDFIQGDTLDNLVEQRGSFGAQEALLVGVDVCSALAAAHQSGLLHRDIKAQNVMRESGGRIVLMDFGLGHETARGDPADFGGTPLYMAPELLEGGPATVRSDLYAVGVLLFHLVTRSYPVEGATLGELRRKHAAGEVRSLRDLRSDLPSSFSRAVQKALASDASGRYGSAGQMTAGLEAAFGRRSVISRRAFWWSAASVAASGAGVTWYLEHRPTSSVAAGASLLVSEISNLTGDSQLNAVADVLRVQLAQSAHFNLLDGDRVRETLKRMLRPPDQKLEVPVAREVALRSATPLVVYGTVSPLGAGYGLGLVVERIEGQPRTPVATDSKLFEARNKDGLFDAIHQAATWIRKSAGEASKDISENDTQPEEATTSSWEALDYFAKGERLLTPASTKDAVTMYKEAVRVDPGFALALARISQGQGTLRNSSEAFAYGRKAVEALAHRQVTRREELRIRGMRALMTEDYAAAEQSMKAFTLQYPLDPLAHHYHATALRSRGRLEEAREELLFSQRLRRTESSLINLISVSLLLGKPEEAAGYLKELRDSRSSFAPFYAALANFLEQNFGGCQTILTTVAQDTHAPLRSQAYGGQACLDAELGRVHEALAVLEEGIAVDAAAENSTGLSRKLLASAHLRLLGGENSSARVLALEATRRDADTECLRRAGSLLARAGFPGDSRRVLARMDAPDEGWRIDTARAILAAEIALAEDHIEEALTNFSKADRLAPPIYPRELLAHAWERAGRIEEALAVWKRIADRPSLVWVSRPDLHAPGLWTEALVRVADLSLRAGRIESGRAALTLFLKIREHADADSPQSAVAQKLLAQYQQ